MGSLHTISAPAPALYASGGRPPVANAYFAVTVDSAVNLLAAREYQDLPRQERLSKAQAEQQGFLNGFADPALGMALDLRVAAAPAASTPVSVAVLGRVWGNAVEGVTRRAQSLRTQVSAAIPRHVTATAVESADEVARLLSPFGGAPVDSAVITRRELIGPPSRPDAGVSYYYSALPFNWPGSDWPAVYAALAASPVPLVLSVAVLPMKVPPQFAQTLLTLADFYGRLARDGEIPGGPYHGKQRLAPDAFAVDAEKAFHDFSRGLSQKAFALRIQVSAAKRLPPGIVETVAEAISPAGYDARRPASAAERRLAEYNLNVINFGMLTGRPEIWGRPDPPDPQLAMLSVLGDARDAACAFRFPVAVDGIVPGFRVRPGQLEQAEAHREDGPVLLVGQVSGTSRDLTFPLRSLAGHALIAGSAGSGKTATALELLRQLWAEHQVPFLVIEPANSEADDYRKLITEPGFESLEVVTVGDEGGTPLRFNPFEVPTGMLVGEHMVNLLDCFKAAFGLPEPLSSVYQDALSLTYLRSGFLSAERATGDGRTWPTVVEFLAAMGEVTAGLRDAGEVTASIEAASTRRARQLVRGVTGSAFMTDRPNDIGRLLDHPVIFELRPLGAGDEQALMMALLLNAVTEHWPARCRPPGLVHVTLVEEAHRLLARAAGGTSSEGAQAKEKAAESFANKLAESRKYGEGVIIAERFPAKLVAEAVKNTSLTVMHRLTAEDDRRSLGETAGMNEAQRQSAARLRTGEALIYGDGFAEAAHASITRTLRADVPPPGAVQPSASPPFSACDRCRAQCAYRGAALSMVNDPAIVNGITAAASTVAHTGLSPAEQRAGLTELRDKLHQAVGRFAALPQAGSGRSDAAFCLFLHIYASSALRGLPAWPTVAALFLQIAADPAEKATSTGDSLLQAAADIAGQAGQSPPERHSR